MKSANVKLFLFILALSMAWGVAYWLFFAGNVTN